jgi:hypothetical protein
MRKRYFMAIATLLLVSWTILHLTISREPRYQGRSLSLWLGDYQRTFWQQIRTRPHDSQLDTNVPAMSEGPAIAVRHIGTNAIPYLLKKLRADETVLEHGLTTLLGRRPIIRLRFADHDMERVHGSEGFMILGREALGAVPALVELTKDPFDGIRYRALYSLYYINPEPETFVPVLVRMVHDSNFQVRDLSAEILARLFPEAAEKENVYMNFPWLKRSTSTNQPVTK